MSIENEEQIEVVDDTEQGYDWRDEREYDDQTGEDGLPF